MASAERWRQIEVIVRSHLCNGHRLVLVCSAVAGVTNLLSALVRLARRGECVDEPLAAIERRHSELASELGVETVLIHDGIGRLSQLCQAKSIDVDVEAEIMSTGELVCSRLAAAWLSSRGITTAWLDARELLTSSPCAGDRDERYLSATCATAFDVAAQHDLTQLDASVVVTQGYIARSPNGETVLLGRGGSDTSAAYIACVIGAERLEIWTDVPGLFTANPHVLPNARLLSHVGYREAQALGALGAKVLHPRAIEAVWQHGIPIEIGWTERPDVAGTCINASRAGRGIKAITSRRHLALFSLRRPPSWQPVGFLADVAACFAKRGLSMDLVSSSCSEIRVTIDLEAFPSAADELDGILRELEETCQPRVIVPVASVSIVGDRVGASLLGSDNAYGIFADEALFMVVHAANEHHVSFVLEQRAAERLVQTAHAKLLADENRHDLGPTWSELVEDIRGHAA